MTMMLRLMMYHLNGSMRLSLNSSPLLPHREIKVDKRLKEDGFLWS